MSEPSSPLFAVDHQPFSSNPHAHSHSHSHSLSEAFAPHPPIHTRSSSNPRPLPTPPAQPSWRHTAPQQPAQPLASAHPVRRLPEDGKPINWARPLRAQASVAGPLSVGSYEPSPTVIFGESSQRNRRLQKSPQTPSFPHSTPDFGSPRSPAFPVTPGTPAANSFAGRRTYSSWSVDREVSTEEGLGLGQPKWDGSALADFMDEDDYYRQESVHSMEVDQPDLPPLAHYNPRDETEPNTPPERIAPPLPLPSAPKVAGKQVATVTRDSVGSLASLAGINAIAAPTPVDARLSLLSRRGHSMLLPSPQTSPRAHASPLLPPSPDSDSSSRGTSASGSGATNASGSALGRSSSQRKIRRKAVPILGEVVKTDSPWTSPALTSTSCVSPALSSLSPASPPLTSPTSPIPPMSFTELPPKPMHVLETIAPPSNHPSGTSSAPTTPRKAKHAVRARSQSDSEGESDGMPVTPVGPDGLAHQMESSLSLRLGQGDEGWENKKARREDGKRGNKFSKLFRRQVEA